MALETTPFDPAAYIDSPEAAAAYLDEALASGDRAFFVDALEVVAKAKGMTALAAAAGMGREAIYKSLSSADPHFSSMVKIIDGLGLRLAVMPKDAAA